MLRDVVVDTNVFVDAGNAGVQRYGAAHKFITSLLAKATDLRVDPGFTNDLATNKSRIVHEYYNNLGPGTPGSAVLGELASSNRIREIENMPLYATRRKVIQWIANTTDRIFLCVAIESDELVLVSHDYQDFQVNKRRKIRREFGVDVIEAHACSKKL